MNRPIICSNAACKWQFDVRDLRPVPHKTWESATQLVCPKCGGVEYEHRGTEETTGQGRTMTNSIPGADSERVLAMTADCAPAPDRERSPYVFGVKPSNWAEQVAAGAPASIGANLAADENLALVIARLEQIAGNFSETPHELAEEALVCARYLAAGAPAETPKPIQRHATDVEIAQWAERHDLGRSLGDSAGMLRAAFEDAESLHQTYAAQPAPIAPAETPKPCNCLQGQCCPVCDPDDCSPAPASQRTAARRDLGPSCTCPSGDGSLRWPCPVHPK